MEHDIDEDNECPWCGKNNFYEYINIDPLSKEGEYEYNCPDCGKDATITLMDKNLTE